MKTIFIGMAITAISFASCNSGSNTAENKKTSDTGHMEMMAMEATATSSTPSSLNEIIAHYLHIKNGLAKDNSKEAATGGTAMMESFAKFDQSKLTAEQKKAYEDIAGDAKEHAEHIGKSGDKIDHQREHFATLSKDVYDLVKAMGGGQTLYQDYCPMYNNNKGATWISETKEISNPYLGAKMPTCGSVKETIK